MRNLALTIRYVGTNYHGFQVQKNAVTVCQTLQDALEKVIGERCDVKGCSRTDAGVHANKFVLSIKTENTIICKGLVFALNAVLPDDIAVVGCYEEEAEFHARYSCKGKRYIYKIYNSRLPDPFIHNRSYRYPVPLDVDTMNTAAASFIGIHDFSAFCTLDNYNKDKSKIRTIYDCSVKKEDDLITISVTGDGFLYNMVRILCGTLIYVGAGKIEPNNIPEIIKKGDRTLAGPTLPPQGLYLDEVYYSPINI